MLVPQTLPPPSSVAFSAWTTDYLLAGPKECFRNASAQVLFLEILIQLVRGGSQIVNSIYSSLGDSNM